MFLCGCLEWVLLSRSWGWGRVERGTAPRGGPALGSRESGNDGGGGGAGEGCWCRRGSPALAGRAVREPPLLRCALGARRFGWRRGRFPPARERRWGGGWATAGEGDGPARRPCPGFPLSRERREGRPFDRLRANGVARRGGGVTRGGCGCGTYVLFWMVFSLGLASGGVGFGSLDRGFAPGTHARCFGLWV